MMLEDVGSSETSINFIKIHITSQKTVNQSTRIVIILRNIHSIFIKERTIMWWKLPEYVSFNSKDPEDCVLRLILLGCEQNTALSKPNLFLSSGSYQKRRVLFTIREHVQSRNPNYRKKGSVLRNTSVISQFMLWICGLRHCLAL